MELRGNTNLKLGIVAGVLVAGAVFVWVAIVIAISNQPSVETNGNVETININIEPDVQEVVEINDTPRRTNGVLVEEEVANLKPFAVMIENLATEGVRPQFGLSQAEIVYEIIVEGGITRFLAVYSSELLPPVIGPVRSARPTYLEYASEYDAIYAHAGGSPQALEAIDGLQLENLSALTADGKYFYRDFTRVAPHNLFTSHELLAQAKSDKGLTDAQSSFESWVFKEEEKPDVEPENHFVNIDFGSGPLYETRYEYDYSTNTYQRYNGSELQRDANNEEILVAKNVVVQIVEAGTFEGGEGRVNFDVTGSGDVYVFRDGEVIEGTWEKEERSSRTMFYDEDEDEISLNRGTTWISILPVTGSIDYE